MNHAAVFLEPNFFSMSEKSLSAPDVNQPGPQEVGLGFCNLIGWYVINPLPHRDAFSPLFQTEQTQIRQLLLELPDQGLLYLLYGNMTKLILH